MMTAFRNLFDVSICFFVSDSIMNTFLINLERTFALTLWIEWDANGPLSLSFQRTFL